MGGRGVVRSLQCSGCGMGLSVLLRWISGRCRLPDRVWEGRVWLLRYRGIVMAPILRAS